MTPTTAPASTAETLPAQLRRYADAIENELTIGRPRRVGDASDCSSPVMREAATIIDQLRAELASLKPVAPAAAGVVAEHRLKLVQLQTWLVCCVTGMAARPDHDTIKRWVLELGELIGSPSPWAIDSAKAIRALAAKTQGE